MSIKPAVPATVTKIEGRMALITPNDATSAPAALKQGHWVARKNFEVGQVGMLTWFSTPSMGNWSFSVAA
jgi:hypothetical protein